MNKTFLSLSILSMAAIISGCGCITFSPDPLYGYDPGYTSNQGSQYPAGWEPAPYDSRPAVQSQAQVQSQSQTQTSTQSTAITITGGSVPAQQGSKPASIVPVQVPVTQAAPAVPVKSPAEVYFKNGENWERKGNCPFTLLNYGQAVKLDRNYRPGRAQYGIGRCFVRLGNCPKAIEAFRDALSATIFSDTPAIYSLLADCEMKQGQFGPAENTVVRGLLVHPNDLTLKKQKGYLDSRKAPLATAVPVATPVATPVVATPVAMPVVATPVATPVVATPVATPVVATPVVTPTPVVLEPPVVTVPVPVVDEPPVVKPEENAVNSGGKSKGKFGGLKKNKTNQGLHKGWDKNGKNAAVQAEQPKQGAAEAAVEPSKDVAKEAGNDQAGDDQGKKDKQKVTPEKPATPETKSPVSETKEVPGNPPEENPGNSKDKGKGKDK